MRPDNPFLRSACLKKGWTAQEVSTRLGVSLATYRRWESGQQIPRLASLRALCTLFGHSREELGFPFIPLLARGEQATSDSPEGEAPLPTDPLERWGISIGYAWQAYMAGAQADLERLLLTYTANLAAPTLAPGPRQQQAAGLLAQVYQLRALVELERGDFVAAQLNGTQALVYSQLAQDPNLYMASQLRLATIFTAYKRPGSALHAYTEALRCAHEREGAISPLLRSWVHAGVAVLLTSMGRDEALASLEAALAWFPETPEQDPSFAYTRWDESLLYLYEGQMFLRIGQLQEPWEAFAHIDELQPAPAERVRAEVLRLKAYTSCVLGHLVQSCIYLEAARKRGTRPAERAGCGRTLCPLRAHACALGTGATRAGPGTPVSEELNGRGWKILKKATGMKKTTIYVVRHAQSEHNRSGSLSDEPTTTYGTLGSPLTEEGKRQASLLARELQCLPVAGLFASHLNRARQTAEILGELLKLPVTTTEALQERLDEESLQEAGRRLFDFLQETADAWREKTIVVVSHGAIFRGMLILLGFATVQELPAGSIANTGYVLLETDGERWMITNTHGVIKVPYVKRDNANAKTLAMEQPRTNAKWE